METTKGNISMGVVLIIIMIIAALIIVAAQPTIHSGNEVLFKVDYMDKYSVVKVTGVLDRISVGSCTEFVVWDGNSNTATSVEEKEVPLGTECTKYYFEDNVSLKEGTWEVLEGEGVGFELTGQDIRVEMVPSLGSLAVFAALVIFVGGLFSLLILRWGFRR